MTTEIPLSSRKYPGLVALVDDEDYEKVAGHNWCPSFSKRTFYAIGRPKGGGRIERMHRLILGGAVVDHINHDGLDNRRANLRSANVASNNRNSRPHRDGSSRFKGVAWDSARGRWIAKICADRRQRFLGRFSDEEEAAHAYDRAASELHGPFAVLNFPHDCDKAVA